MSTFRPQLAALVFAALLVTSCSPAGGGSSASSEPAASPSATDTGTPGPSPDTETTVPAPAPESSAPPAGPGQGNAELAISVVPDEGQAAINYTLVCQVGVPAAESSHPAADAACAAIKENAALLSPATQGTAQACTEQYGGPQTATVTGVVDGVAVDAEFARTNGCEISAWDAAKDVLAHAGGAA